MTTANTTTLFGFTWPTQQNTTEPNTSITPRIISLRQGTETSSRSEHNSVNPNLTTPDIIVIVIACISVTLFLIFSVVFYLKRRVTNREIEQVHQEAEAAAATVSFPSSDCGRPPMGTVSPYVEDEDRYRYRGGDLGHSWRGESFLGGSGKVRRTAEGENMGGEEAEFVDVDLGNGMVKEGGRF